MESFLPKAWAGFLVLHLHRLSGHKLQNSLCHLRLGGAESSFLPEGPLWPFLAGVIGLLQKALHRYYIAAFLDTDLSPPATLLLNNSFPVQSCRNSNCQILGVSVQWGGCKWKRKPAFFLSRQIGFENNLITYKQMFEAFFGDLHSIPQWPVAFFKSSSGFQSSQCPPTHKRQEGLGP